MKKGTNNDPFKEKHDRQRRTFWIFAGFVLVSFFAGIWTGKETGFDKAYNTGYEVATRHITKTILTKMDEGKSFYIADMGIRFYPVDINTVVIKPVKGNEVKTLSAENRTGSLSLNEALTP